MITKTSLQHPRLRIRLDHAMREAAQSSMLPDSWCGASRVSSIHVLHFRNRPRGFVFLDARGLDVTETVRKALREVHSG